MTRVGLSQGVPKRHMSKSAVWTYDCTLMRLKTGRFHKAEDLGFSTDQWIPYWEHKRTTVVENLAQALLCL